MSISHGPLNIISKYCVAFARLCLLFPLRHILSVSQKPRLSQLFIFSLFDYADTVYIPGLSKRLLHRIQLLKIIQNIQNSCFRFFYGSRLIISFFCLNNPTD